MSLLIFDLILDFHNLEPLEKQLCCFKISPPPHSRALGHKHSIKPVVVKFLSEIYSKPSQQR